MDLTRYRTFDDVANGLAALEQHFRARNDRRCIFLTLYGTVSVEMRNRVKRGAFEDPAWVHKYGVAFANLYLDALDAYERRDFARVPKSWQICFDAAARDDGFVMQHLLMGVNAHVNNDLPWALDGVAIDPNRASRYRDHCAVNAVLASMTERATQRLSELYAPGLRGVDACAGEIDEMLSAFSLEVARESAWESAVALANARESIERRLASRMVGTRATIVARLLAAPSRNPALITACRRIESGTLWTDPLAILRSSTH